MVILRGSKRPFITLLGPDEAKLPAAAILLSVGACAAIVTIQTSAPAWREINELGAAAVSGALRARRNRDSVTINFNLDTSAVHSGHVSPTNTDTIDNSYLNRIHQTYRLLQMYTQSDKRKPQTFTDFI